MSAPAGTTNSDGQAGGRAANAAGGGAPPHSIEAEQSVLGAILLSERVHYALVIEEGLKPEDFYRDRHRVLYESMLALYEQSEPIDVLTVTEHLRSRGKLEDVGCAAEVDELSAAVPAVGNLRRYGAIVKELSLLRRLLGATYQIQAAVHGHEAAPRELVERAERVMLEVAHDDRQKDFIQVGDVLHAEIAKWQQLSAEGRSLTGTPSGFTDLDAITGGFQPGNLIVVAARPAMGKCLSGRTLVYDPRAGARRRLDEVVASVEAGDETWVASLSPDLKLRATKVARAWRNGVKQVFRLTTGLGRTTYATANHPFLTLEGWRALGELRRGDRVAVPRPAKQGRPVATRRPSRTAAGEPAPGGHRGAPARPSRTGAGELAPAGDGGDRAQVAISDVWWDEISCIGPAGYEETFDLEVPGDHNFVADDLIVHNSALVTNIAENVALNRDRPRPVALFSLEMSEAELAQRFVASQASIKGDDLRKGRLRDEAKWKRVLKVAGEYAAAPLFIDDSSDVGILEVRAKARRLHQQTMTEYGGLGLVIVDYLQLLRADSRIQNRVQQVGEMSRGLKILARELNVPVIALSQLSRGVESRTDKRPMLSDLRECVTGDTLVVLADGRRVPIRNLVGTQPEVVAVDERDRLTVARSAKVWRVGVRQTVRLRLASGRELHATTGHRIRTGAGWKTIADVTSGDGVALARRLPEPAGPERWPTEHVVLLGQVIGDGSYLAGRPLRYTISSAANGAAVRDAAERGFGVTVTRRPHRPGRHQLVLSARGNRWAPGGVHAWLRQLGVFGQRSWEKGVPQAAFRLADDQVALLLRHLWATGGTASTGRRRADGRPLSRVAYSANSRGLACDVAALLHRLGIVARTPATRDPRPMHHVLVSGAAAQRLFLERVGAFGPLAGPADALADLLATAGSASKRAHRAGTTCSTPRSPADFDAPSIEARRDVRERAAAAAGTPRPAIARLRGT